MDIHDQTHLSTYKRDNSQGLSFCLKLDTQNSWRPRYHTPSCNHETCRKYRSLRKNACHDKDVTESVLSRSSQIIAQIFTTNHFRYWYSVSQKHRMITQSIFSWRSTLQQTWPQTWIKTQNCCNPRFCKRIVEENKDLVQKKRKQILCSLTKHKNITTKKQRPRLRKKKTTARFYNLKRTTKDQKYQFETLFGLALLLWKKF